MTVLKELTQSCLNTVQRTSLAALCTVATTATALALLSSTTSQSFSFI